MELTYNCGILTVLTIGNGYGHIALEIDDVYAATGYQKELIGKKN
jgi:hypothetical protein